MDRLIYATKNIVENKVCIKMYDNDGKELSIAFDDSSGAMDVLGRIDAIVFASKESGEKLKDERYISTPNDLLDIMKEFLGVKEKFILTIDDKQKQQMEHYLNKYSELSNNSFGDRTKLELHNYWKGQVMGMCKIISTTNIDIDTDSFLRHLL